VIGIRRPSVSLMSRTSALTRKPKGLGRLNFAQGYPRSHATPTPNSRSKGQKSRWGGGILWRPPSRTACLRKDEGDWVRCLAYEIKGIRPRGRPKKTWKVVNNV